MRNIEGWIALIVTVYIAVVLGLYAASALVALASRKRTLSAAYLLGGSALVTLVFFVGLPALFHVSTAH